MKSWVTFIFVQLFLITTITLHSQQLNCDSIQIEDLICDFELLDGFEGTMNSEDSGGTQPTPLCQGEGEPDNIIWFGFIAREGDYEIILSFENCEIGIPESGFPAGIQVGVFTDCTFTEPVFCTAGIGDTLDKVIPSSLFQPGQDYFLYIDGFAETVCDYKIDVVGSFDNNVGIFGNTFIDYNADGIRNDFEPALKNVNISIDPGELTILSDDNGYFSFDAMLGESYTLIAIKYSGRICLFRSITMFV